MSEPSQNIPVAAADVGWDFDATASPPPGATRRSLTAAAVEDYDDPGHLATSEEWAAIVARAEGRT